MGEKTEERKIDIEEKVRGGKQREKITDKREIYQMKEKDRDQKEERKIEMEDGKCRYRRERERGRDRRERK